MSNVTDNSMLIKNSICKAGRDLIDLALTSGTGGNISVFDREKGAIYITPTTMPYDDITPADIPVYRIDGTPIEKPREPSMELYMHLNIYKSREDVNAVVHTHSGALIAAADLGHGSFLDELGLPVAPPMQVGSKLLADECCKAIGNHPILILKGHGAVAVGSTLENAMSIALDYEKRACKLKKGYSDC